MSKPPFITSPDDPALDELCQWLAERSAALDVSGEWPAEQLRRCGEQGVYRWFVPAEYGGAGWSETNMVRGLIKLSTACVTTTFIITQHVGGCRRIAASHDAELKARLLPELLDGTAITTIGISHLTTSRRHLAQPVLSAREHDGGFVIDGYIPWVTGAVFAKFVVAGAVLDDGRQILFALPMDGEGVRAEPPAKLVGLTASATGTIRCDGVLVSRDHLLAGPAKDLVTASAASTGGVQTSAVAVGLASAAIHFLEQESQNRPDLLVPMGSLRAEWNEVRYDLLAITLGEGKCSPHELRGRANSLVLRATQAALVAAKGTGYVVGHPAGRWCREALFFLVWSCPQGVLSANLCELAGIE